MLALNLSEKFANPPETQPDYTIRQAIYIFLRQAGYGPITYEKFMLHEMAHILAGATNGTLADEGRVAILEMVLIGNSFLCSAVLSDGSILIRRETPPSLEEIRSESVNFQVLSRTGIRAEILKEKLKIASDYFDLDKHPDRSHIDGLNTNDHRQISWSDGFFEHMTETEQSELQNLFAQSEKIAKWERAKTAAKELSEAGFQKALSRAQAIESHFRQTHQGKRLIDFKFDEIMNMRLSDFGIQAIENNGKIKFVPFIPVAETNPAPMADPQMRMV